MSIKSLINKIFLQITIVNYIRDRYLLFILRFIHLHSIDGEKIRKRKLKAILKYAKNHTAYYKRILNNLEFDELDNFQEIPLLDKSIIRTKRKELISDEINNLGYYKMNTGGSTGEPLDFPMSFNIDPVHQEFLFRLMGYKHGDVILAFDGSDVPRDLLSKNIFWIKNGHDIPYGRISFSSLYLNSDTIKYYINEIIRLKPAFLRGYPSFINELSVFILENEIALNFNVKGVELTAEMSYDIQVKTIEKAFKTKIFFQYGHSEASIFAYTFDNSMEYLCSPIYGYTEVLDENGNSVNIGESGEIVVTGFSNKVMPFIRYKTGDMAVYNGTVNGIVRIKKISGRTQDLLFLNNGEKMYLTALVFGQHYSAFKNIKKWQIVQDGINDISINIIKDINFSNADAEEIKKNFKLLCDVDVKVVFTEAIPNAKNGKFKFLVQNIK